MMVFGAAFENRGAQQESTRLKVSSYSPTTSPRTVTLICWVDSPASKATAPEEHATEVSRIGGTCAAGDDFPQGAGGTGDVAAAGDGEGDHGFYAVAAFGRGGSISTDQQHGVVVDHGGGDGAIGDGGTVGRVGERDGEGFVVFAQRVTISLRTVKVLLVSPSAKLIVPVLASNSARSSGCAPLFEATQSTWVGPVAVPLRVMLKANTVVPLLLLRIDGHSSRA